MLNDLKHSLRVIRKYPLANSVIVFTIACLVAVIGLLYGTFENTRHQQMPFEDADRMVRLWRVNQTQTTDYFAGKFFYRFREQSQTFEKIGAMSGIVPFTLTAAKNPSTLVGVHSTADILKMTGKPPLIGRLFDESDETPGNDRIVILGEKTWRKHFNADESVLGQSIELNEKQYVVVGVVPESLQSTHLVRMADVWVPRSFTAHPSRKHNLSANIVGLLKPDSDTRQAQAEFDVFAQQIAQTWPKTDHKGKSVMAFGKIRLAPLDQNLRRRGLSDMAFQDFFALGLIACVVLIACFNMTCLFLLQATARAREMAVRLAVGATRSRIVRQMLLESVLIAIIGGACGLAISLTLMKLGETTGMNFTFDPVLYAIAFGSATGIGALVAIIPAIRAGQTAVSLVLKDGGQSSASRTRHRFRNFLVGSQIGMVTILTITAVLFSQSFLGTLNSETRFDPERLTSVNIALQSNRYREAGPINTFTRQAFQTVSEMPGVERVAVIKPAFRVAGGLRRQVTFADQSRSLAKIQSGVIETSPDLFAILGQKILQGHDFSPGNEVLNEAIVNEEFIRQFSEHGDLVGEQFTLAGTGAHVFNIVGIIENRSKKLDANGTTPRVFISHLHQTELRGVGILVETKADAAQFGQAVRETLKRLDANQPIGEALVIADFIDDQIRPLQFRALIMLGVAGFAMFMSLMGVYGVVAYAAIERTREMGIRMALGADRRRIVMTVMSEGTRLLLWGGIPASFVAVAAILQMPDRSFPGVDLSSPTHYLIGIVAVAVAGMLAALLPARKMVNLNPSQALRYE
jgi:predicted permease